jgi:hypothetical protein
MIQVAMQSATLSWLPMQQLLTHSSCWHILTHPTQMIQVAMQSATLSWFFFDGVGFACQRPTS